MPLGALGTGLAIGGISAGAGLIGRGVVALTPAAREQRKLDKQMREDAIKAYEKGKKKGYGPSRQARTNMIASSMQQYDNQAAASQNNLRRQEAALGFGRSGQLAGVRQNMAQQRADALGRTQGQVEDRARSIGAQREAMINAQLGRERARLAQLNAERRAAFGGAMQKGVEMGAGAYGDAKMREELATWNVGSGEVAASTGTAPDSTMTNRESRQYERAMRRGHR